MPKRLCRLPATFSVDLLLEPNPIFQIDAPGIVGEFEVIPFTRGKRLGELVSGFSRTVIVLPKRAGPQQASPDDVLITPDGKAPSPDAKHLGRHGGADTLTRREIQDSIYAGQRNNSHCLGAARTQ
jgi:hypothetical protein